MGINICIVLFDTNISSLLYLFILNENLLVADIPCELSICYLAHLALMFLEEMLLEINAFRGKRSKKG